MRYFLLLFLAGVTVIWLYSLQHSPRVHTYKPHKRQTAFIEIPEISAKEILCASREVIIARVVSSSRNVCVLDKSAPAHKPEQCQPEHTVKLGIRVEGVLRINDDPHFKNATFLKPGDTTTIYPFLSINPPKGLYNPDLLLESPLLILQPPDHELTNGEVSKVFDGKQFIVTWYGVDMWELNRLNWAKTACKK